MTESETREHVHPEPVGRSYLLQTDGSGTGTVLNPTQGAIGVVQRDPEGNLVPGGELSKAIAPQPTVLPSTGLLSKGSN